MDFCWDLPQHLERKMKRMNKDKESVVELMMSVYEAVNTRMALMGGMSEEEVEEKTTQARPSMTYYMSEIYDKLEQNDILITEQQYNRYMPRYHTKRMYGPYFPWDHGRKHPIEEVIKWEKEHRVSIWQKIKNIIKRINTKQSLGSLY